MAWAPPRNVSKWPEREREESEWRLEPSREPGQLRESLRHVTLPRQRLAAASVRISRFWVKTPGVSDVLRVHRAM